MSLHFTFSRGASHSELQLAVDGADILHDLVEKLGHLLEDFLWSF